MAWFRKQRSELEALESELRRSRPEPSDDLVRSVASRLQRQAPRSAATPGLRYRGAVAVALTASLLVVAAIAGGVSYASSATTHAFDAISHVFVANHATGNDASSSLVGNGVASGASAGSVLKLNGKHDTTFGTDDTTGKGDEGDNDNDNDNGGNDNPSHHQYLQFEFVCLAVPPSHPVVHITLYLPTVAAENLIAHGLATAGRCP